MSHPTTQSSGLLIGGTNSVWTGRGTLNGITVISDGVNQATVTVFDNPNGTTGTVLASATAVASIGTVNLVFYNAVRCMEGITVQVSGTGATAIAYFGAA